MHADQRTERIHSSRRYATGIFSTDSLIRALKGPATFIRPLRGRRRRWYCCFRAWLNRTRPMPRCCAASTESGRGAALDCVSHGGISTLSEIVTRLYLQALLHPPWRSRSDQLTMPLSNFAQAEIYQYIQALPHPPWRSRSDQLNLARHFSAGIRDYPITTRRVATPDFNRRYATETDCEDAPNPALKGRAAVMTPLCGVPDPKSACWWKYKAIFTNNWADS